MKLHNKILMLVMVMILSIAVSVSAFALGDKAVIAEDLG